MSQEGGFPVVVVLIPTIELFLEHTSSLLPPHIVQVPSIYSAAVLGQHVSHHWLFPSVILTSILSRD